MVDAIIGTDSHSLSFFRAQPGQERKIAKSLCAALPDSDVYKVFGAADFAVVSQFESRWPSAQDLSVLTGNECLDRFTITCFEWESAWRGSEARASKPLAGISFFKMKEDLLRQHGVVIEALMASQLNSIFEKATSEHDLDISFLGNFGWFEAVLIVRGTHLSHIMQTVMSARNLRVQTGGESLPAFKSSITVPAIRLDDGAPAAGGSFENTQLRLLVTCSAGADMSIQEGLSKQFDSASPAFIFGMDDYAIDELENYAPEEYVSRLWSFREQYDSLLFRTNTVVTFPASQTAAEGFVGDDVDRLKDWYQLADASDAIALLSAENEALGRGFRDAIQTLGACVQDRQVRTAYADLVPWSRAVTRHILKDDWLAGVKEEPQLIGDQFDMLSFAISQRSLGTRLFFDRPSSLGHVAGGPHGIHRILGAASAIPSDALRQLNRDWAGFMVFGFARDYHRYNGGIISLPLAAIYDPLQWRPCFHEIGHEYGAMIDVANNRELITALEANELLSDTHLEFMWEVYSEIVGCVLGYGVERWDHYVSDSWSYLCAHSKMEDTPGQLNFLLRFELANLYIQTATANRKFDTSKAIKAEGRRFLLRVKEQCAVLGGLKAPDLEALWTTMVRLYPALEALAKLIPQYRVDNRKMSEVAESLSRGEVLTENVSPPVILGALATVSAENRFRASAATILTFWHNYQTTVLRPSEPKAPN